MKYISEFREQKIAEKIAGKIAKVAKSINRKVRLMQVCGTHGMAILRYGLKVFSPRILKKEGIKSFLFSLLILCIQEF